MDNETRQAVALLRHQIISPVLMESDRVRMDYFRETAKCEFNVPGRGKRKFSAWTMKSWFLNYKHNGFKGLQPKVRQDTGKRRTLLPSTEEKIVEMRRDLMDLSVAHFYRRAKASGALGDPAICQQTLRRLLMDRNLIVQADPKSKSRRRFEMSHFGELWVGDFMHGPQVEGETRGGRSFKRKAILLAIIDDYSRFIVGARWSLAETTETIEGVFKDAVLTYGKPDKLYVDNGPSFSSDYLRLVCAQIGIGLVHSKPYDSPSRGKIERFFRTVRECFLIDAKVTTLSDLDQQFKIWLRDWYHPRKHHGIGEATPIDRYTRSIHDYPRSRVPEDTLEKLFMAKAQRKVNKDATLSFNKLIYETPAKYIGTKVEIRFRQDRPLELFLYDHNECVSQLKVVDSRANGKTYKPRPRDTSVSYQGKNDETKNEGSAQ
jgi:putative transposase